MAAMLFVALSLPTYRRLLAVSLETRTIGENLLTQSHAIFYLAGQLVRITNGNADPQLPQIGSLDWNAALACFALANTLVWSLLNLRRRPLASFAVLWFMLWLAPTNSLLPRLDVANDRQLYLASMGPAWWLAVHLTSWRPDRAVLRPAAMISILVALSWATYQRNLVYQSRDRVLAGHRRPQSRKLPRGEQSRHGLRGRVPIRRCRDRFKRAIALSGDDYHSRINLILAAQGPAARRGSRALPPCHRRVMESSGTTRLVLRHCTVHDARRSRCCNVSVRRSQRDRKHRNKPGTTRPSTRRNHLARLVGRGVARPGSARCRQRVHRRWRPGIVCIARRVPEPRGGRRDLTVCWLRPKRLPLRCRHSAACCRPRPCRFCRTSCRTWSTSAVKL